MQTSVRQFLEPALAAIRAVPGVEAAGSDQLSALCELGQQFDNIRYEGKPADDPTRCRSLNNAR